eukprot:3897086-Rhodomonas_salina.1
MRVAPYGGVPRGLLACAYAATRVCMLLLGRVHMLIRGCAYADRRRSCGRGGAWRGTRTRVCTASRTRVCTASRRRRRQRARGRSKVRGVRAMRSALCVVRSALCVVRYA